MPNSSELAEIALKNYYETLSTATLTNQSTQSNADSEPFYKDISPRRNNKFSNDIDAELEKEKFKANVFENHNRTTRSISNSSRKVR